MPYCPVCKSELRAGVTHCEKCDVALAAPPPNPAFHRVYYSTDLSDAYLVELLLERSGIHAELENERSGLSAIGLLTSAAPVGVTVPAGDARAAEEIVRQALKSRSPVYPATKRLWQVAVVIISLPMVAALFYSLFE